MASKEIVLDTADLEHSMECTSKGANSILAKLSLQIYTPSRRSFLLNLAF